MPAGSAGKRYAQAAAAIAQQAGTWSRWRQDLTIAAAALRDDRLLAVLQAPRVSLARKSAILAALFGEQLATETIHLLQLLVRRRRIALFAEVHRWFLELADRAEGIERYTVVSAVPLAEDERTAEWDSVRNYQARNFLRDELKEGDGVLFYHSSADPVGVVGTAAVRDPAFVRALVAAHGPARVVVGLDAVDGRIAVSGWTEATDVTASALMAEMASAGVRRFVHTDIARDGMLGSPDFDGLADLVRQARELGADVRVIASGGVATLDHLRRLAELGVEGAIVGSAIYRGSVDLAEAVAELAGG